MSGFKNDGDKDTLRKLDIEGWPIGVAFQPHGIYVLKEDATLYVISHGMKQGGERIEVFNVVCDSKDIPISLKYLYSIHSDELNKNSYGALNSLVVVSKDKFFIT